MTTKTTTGNIIARALLWHANVFSIADIAVLLDLPKPTIELLLGRGEGPRIFFLGRRRYVVKTELCAWIERMHAAPHMRPPVHVGPPPLNARGRPRKTRVPVESE